jgi:hypothetical protein
MAGPGHGTGVLCYSPAARDARGLLLAAAGGVETEGPWRTYSGLVAKRVGAQERKQPTATWEAGLAAAAEAGGAEVLLDTEPAHTMEWPDGDAIFEGMSRGGPWHATRMRRGDGFMEEIKADFLAVHPVGEPVRHTPHARLLVFRKLGGTAAM